VVKNTRKIGMLILLLTLQAGISLGVNLETIRTVPVNIARTSIGLALLEACPAGQTNCNGQCSVSNNDTQIAVHAANNGTCVSGVCTGVASTGGISCPAGETNCNGKCVDLSSDPRNCGSCGRVCSAGKFCLSGVCSSGLLQ
jgi:hypothetical protein